MRLIASGIQMLASVTRDIVSTSQKVLFSPYPAFQVHQRLKIHLRYLMKGLSFHFAALAKIKLTIFYAAARYRVI
eukprot:IDg5546t1